MTDNEVKTLMESVAGELNSTVQFSDGSVSLFNWAKNVYPAINIDDMPCRLTVNSSYAVFDITGAVYVQSNVDAIQSQLRQDIGPAFKLIREFSQKLNERDNVQISDPVNISKPFFKILDDCLSGYTFSFTLTVPSSYKYCC